MRGIERLECVYYSAPIPRNAAALTILSLLFDRIHFPGVYLPKGNYGEDALRAKITRLEELHDPYYETALLIGILKFLEHRLPLDGICEFPVAKDDFDRDEDEERAVSRLAEQLYDSVHPPREGFLPTFDTRSIKMLPESNQYIEYPGLWHYHAKAIHHSNKLNLPLVNDFSALPFIVPESYKDDAQALSTILAVECLKLALPELPILTPRQITEFRIENRQLLHAFRAAMLRYAREINQELGAGSLEDVQRKTAVLADTEIVPTLHDLKRVLDGSTRSWFRRVGDITNIAGLLGLSYMTKDVSKLPAAAASVLDFLASELGAQGDRADAQKRSGLYYVLKVKKLTQ